MKKRFILLMILFLIPLYVTALVYPQLDSKMVEIYDLTDDKILYEVGSKDKTYIASLTKIATTITAIESIKDLDTKVTITWSILNTVSPESSVAGLKSGDVVTYRDLLYASMLPSGADATNALAILISGSIPSFVNKMNDLAKRIGLNNTHFVNVTGLDVDNHYSTLDDVRKLLVYALEDGLFKEIYTTRKYTLTNGLKVQSTLYTYTKGTNFDISPILGSKSGFTDYAGYALSSLSNINGHQVIIIVLKASRRGSYCYNIVDTLNLIGFLKLNYQNQVLINKDQVVKLLPVKLSNIDSYEIKASSEIIKFLPSDYDESKIRIEYDGIETLSYKNNNGDKVGTIKYYFDNELIGSEEVIVNKDININLLKVLLKYHYAILGIIILFCIIKYKHKRHLVID